MLGHDWFALLSWWPKIAAVGKCRLCDWVPFGRNCRLL